MHSLSAGKSVVIDRTNVDESQRSTWVDVGRSFPGVELQAVVFQTPLEASRWARSCVGSTAPAHLHADPLLCPLSIPDLQG